MNEDIELTVEIEADEADEHGLELLARDLVKHIHAGTDVRLADPVRPSDIDTDSEATARHVVAVVGQSHPRAIPRLLRVLEAWLGPRRPDVKVTLTLAGRSLELPDAPLMANQELRDLVATFAGPETPPVTGLLTDDELDELADATIPGPETRVGEQRAEQGERPPQPRPPSPPAEVVGKPGASAPASTFADGIESALKAVTPGRFAFNPPAQMRQGQEERVAVGVVRSKQMDEELRTSLAGSGVPIVGDIRTSSVMSVELQGDGGFDIRPQGPTEQPVISDDVTNWLFNVRALKSGKHKLTVIVALVLQVPGHTDLRRSLPVLERSVHVRVAPGYLTGQFVRTNWQWIIGTCIALSGGVAAWVKLAH